jgi:hypothetical protein
MSFSKRVFLPGLQALIASDTLFNTTEVQFNYTAFFVTPRSRCVRARFTFHVIASFFGCVMLAPLGWFSSSSFPWQHPCHSPHEQAEEITAKAKVLI